jgi:phosphoglycolate phosphatase
LNTTDTGLRPRAYDLVVFDWDGTLYDSTALIVRCIQAACEDLALPVPDRKQASYVIGLGLHDALAHVAPTLPAERVPELGVRYRHHYFQRQHELSCLTACCPCWPRSSSATTGWPLPPARPARA